MNSPIKAIAGGDWVANRGSPRGQGTTHLVGRADTAGGTQGAWVLNELQHLRSNTTISCYVNFPVNAARGVSASGLGSHMKKRTRHVEYDNPKDK